MKAEFDENQKGERWLNRNVAAMGNKYGELRNGISERCYRGQM
jgi:hypothetical protein